MTQQTDPLWHLRPTTATAVQESFEAVDVLKLLEPDWLDRSQARGLLELVRRERRAQDGAQAELMAE